jgi:uncharacterized membrane protein YpjA
MPPTDRGLLRFFHHFKAHRGWVVVIALVNLVGILYGFYYYGRQFDITPWWLWPFVPDSPLAVLWAELALLAYWAGRPSATLDALAFLGNVQVGLWTCYVLLAYAPSFHTLDFLHGGPVVLNTVLLVGHAGMAVLALIFLHGLRERPARIARTGVAIAALYYFANDALDYFGPDYSHTGCGLRPYTVPCDAGLEPVLAAVTLGLTVTATVLLAVTINVGRE